MSIVITIQAYGHVSMDCLIVALYAQIKVQIQMLRYNLEHLVDIDDEANDIDVNTMARIDHHVIYADTRNKKTKYIVQSRLSKFVEHYQQILWCVTASKTKT